MESRQADATTVKETARILGERIDAATTADELRAIDAKLTRHYENGTLDPPALQRLDVRIMERLARVA